MGDMAETFRDFKEHKRRERTVRADRNTERMRALGIPAFEQSKNVYRIEQGRRVVMYYPSSNCWQHMGKTHRGDLQAFAGWLKNNDFEVNHAS